MNDEKKKASWWSRKKSKDDNGESEDSDKPKDDVQPVPFYKMFKYATTTNKAMYFVGILASIATGLTTPANSLIFGNLANVSIFIVHILIYLYLYRN